MNNNTVVNNSLSTYGKAVMLLTILLVVISSTPILGNPTNYVYTGISIVVLIVLHLGHSYIRIFRSLLPFLLGYVAVNALYRVIGVSDANWGNSMHEYIFLLSFPLVLLIFENCSIKYIRILFFIIVCIISANIVENIVISFLYPEINEISLEYQDTSFLSSINAGSSNFYTLSMFFSLICFFVYINTKEILLRGVMFLSTTVGTIYVIVFCNKGSVVLFLVLSLVLVYVAKHSRLFNSFIITLCVFFVFLLLLIGFYKQELVEMIVNLVPSERLATRLVTVIDKNNPLAESDTISGRQNLYFLSIQTWLSSISNFLYGVGDVRVAYKPETTGVGQHADFLDTLARYGIIGGVFLFRYIHKAIYLFKSFFISNNILQFKVIVFLFILCGCTKSILVPEVGIMIFIMLPLSCRIVNN